MDMQTGIANESIFRGLPLLSGLRRGADELVGARLLDGDVSFPIAVLKREELDNNAAWMKLFAKSRGVSLWPHGKTSMAPGVFKRQIEDGAGWLTLASATQARVAREAGIRRILIANQVVNRHDLAYLARELSRDPDLDLMLFVDSVAGVELLDAALEAAECPRRLGILIEIGVAQGRAGVRSAEEAAEIARVIATRPRLALMGLAGYEGVFTPKDPEGAAKVQRYLDYVADIAGVLDAEGLFREKEIILTAGGSKFFDLVAKRFQAVSLSRPVSTVIRCGCYLFHDVGIYEEAMQQLYVRDKAAAELGRLRPALEIWAEVQSRPEPTRAIVAMGRRDASYDAGLPTPQLWCRPARNAQALPLTDCRMVALNDQHGFLEVPADSPLAVGDIVGFGISHPCTVFDKWQLLCVVDRNYVVAETVRTYFT
jgi:D-serine dehydratase